eukprot:CAMPEP_0117654190 /NCGR_PEP_ID=MMETSP0804-20121206/3612_1 /TAXON_ID=1074897 /ORGANISM="Tetraselmis astigmatica, Strain CCMP880" /LENGTH=821 /DNA_ID=CAMNT_0005460455 /DNA_START=29 /DNA_END=2494 /DNA_ORIENTATION=+
MSSAKDKPDERPQLPPAQVGGFGGLAGLMDDRDLKKPAHQKSNVQEWWDQVMSPALEVDRTRVNLSSTLPYMEGRKSLRMFRGAYMKTRPGLAWFLFVLLFALWTFNGWTSTNYSISATFEVNIGFGAASQMEYLLLVALALVYMMVSIRLMTQYNLAYTTVITAFFVGLSLMQILYAYYSHSSAGLNRRVRSFLLGSFLVVQAMYLVGAWFLRQCLPYMQMRGCLLIKTSLLEETPADINAQLKTPIPTEPRFRPVPQTGMVTSSSFTYVQALLPIFRLCYCKTDTITYSGEVDSQGRPHGYGIWSDSHWHGETLEGWWEEGIPTAPFKSRETGSGSGFRAVRMAFVHGRADGLRSILPLPKHAQAKFGITSAECCVSGLFYQAYPEIRFLTEARTATEIATMVSGSQDAVADAVKRITMAVNWGVGYLIDSVPETSASSVTITTDQESGLKAGEFFQDNDNGNDVVESIHIRAVRPGKAADINTGKDTTSEPAPKQHEEPSRMPFCKVISLDGWKSNYEAHNQEAILFIHGYNTSTEWGSKILGQMMALGNYPSYLKPFVFSWPTGQLLFFVVSKRSAESEEVTEDLVDMLRGLDLGGFKRVHILAHSMGVRVLTAAVPKMMELVKGPEKSQQNLVNATPVQTSRRLEHGLSIASITLLNPEIGLVDFLNKGAKGLRALSRVVTIYGDLKDNALWSGELWNSLDATFIGGKQEVESGMYEDSTCCCGSCVYERSLGTYLYHIKDPHGEYIDIDIVDTTFLEANMQQGVRHNSFAVNKDIVEDVREILTTGRRAAERSRLEPRGDNVYSFMAAPAHVVGI